MLEGWRATWAVIRIHDVWVMPLLELKNLSHFWHYADPSFGWRRKNIVPYYLGEESTELEYTNARRLHELDSVARVLAHRRNRSG